MEGNVHILKDFYDDIAEEYADEEYQNDSLLKILERFVTLLPASPKILDMGCGAGYHSKALRSFRAMVTGIDISEKAIQIAQSKNSGCRFEVMDFMNMGDDIGCFDGIISIATLMHIKKDDLPVVFSQINKRLNDDGFLLLIVSNGNGKTELHFSKTIDDRHYDFPTYFYDGVLLNELALESSIYFVENWSIPEKYSQKGYRSYLYQKRNK